MKRFFLPGYLAVVACAGLLAFTHVQSATAATNSGAAASAGMPADDSLASEKIVLQISDPVAAKQTLVLNVVGNLIKYYGPDAIAIDVVAYGPGLRLLFKDNENAQRIKDLATQGVHFKACQNTMKAMGKNSADLNPVAEEVPAGIVHIMQREKQGWAYARP